jgi:hypothetical protein
VNSAGRCERENAGGRWELRSFDLEFTFTIQQGERFIFLAMQLRQHPGAERV